MFEQTFKNIDDLLYKDSGADSKFDGKEDYTYNLDEQYSFTDKALANFPMPVGPSSKIKTLVCELDKSHSDALKLEDSYRKKITALDELIKFILQKAFNRELTTSESLSA